MKRMISLILALAMVMSLFTSAAFAEETPAPDPAGVIANVTYTDANCKSVYADGTITIYYLSGYTIDESKFAVTKVTDTDTVGTLTYNSGTLTVPVTPTGDGATTTDYEIAVDLKPITYTVTPKTEDAVTWKNVGTTYYFMHENGTDVSGDNFNTSVSGVDGLGINVTAFSPLTVKITLNSGDLFTVNTGYTVVNDALYTTLNINAPGEAAIAPPDGWGITAGLDGAGIKSGAAYANIKSGATATAATLEITSNNPDTTNKMVQLADLTVKKTNADAAASGTATLYIELNVSKVGGEIKVPVVVNGTSTTYAKGNQTVTTSLANLVANAVKGSASTLPAVTALTLDIPATSATTNFALNIIKADGTTVAAAEDYAYSFTTESLVVKSNPGYIGKLEVPYTATVGGKFYSGKIVFESGYATATSSTQYAPFYSEEFHLDAISNATHIAAGNAKTPSNTSVTSWQVSPNSHTTNWPQTYTVYTSTGVSRQHTVTFVPVSYDLISYVEDGSTPFAADYFEAFAAAVTAEQKGTVYSGYLDSVRIYDVKVPNKYTLYYGSTALTYSKDLTPAQLEGVTMDVIAGGAYEIDFTATYKYYASRNSNTLTTFSGITGRILVYAGNDGDIKYEVSYGDTVTFDTADFQWLYKKLAGSTKTLSYLTVDALPIYGGLYSTNRTSNAYKVTAGDLFYVDPRNTQNDLDYLTYWAASSYTSEYSVYVPVTMHGTGATVSAVVEIVINGDIPFADVAKNSTFYDYIRYCYNNNIMGGKSATKFDAKSNISRIQLVTTLYRMAGSPTTYNSRTLPFADTKNLSTEFTNALKWAYAKGIASGSGNNFNPNTAVTRQAMVTILYRYARTAGYDTSVWSEYHLANYTDGGKVSASMRDAMNWAVDYELISGNGSSLNPSGSTTRGAAAKILANFHKTYVG